MTPTKDEIKKWLKRGERDRAWLALQCGVKKRTVNDWLSTSREIPAKAVLKIQNLMKKSDAEPEDDFVEITVRFSGDRRSILERFKKEFPEENIEEYLADKLIEFAIGMDKAKSTIEEQTRSDSRPGSDHHGNLNVVDGGKVDGETAKGQRKYPFKRTDVNKTIYPKDSKQEDAGNDK